MQAIDLNWLPTEHAGKPARDLRTGKVLFYAIFGRWSRFCIEEIYQHHRQGEMSRGLYVLRDAERPLENGRSPVVARSDVPQRLVDHAFELERQDGALGGRRKVEDA